MARWTLWLLEICVLALAAWQVWDVAVTIAARLDYGYDLEWMEGATLVTGMRARDGLPYYTLPQVDYVPFIYPPLYAWIMGALAHVFPLGYTLGRSISTFGSTLAAGAIVYGAWRAGARLPLAIGCAALFAGAYEEGGTFYDLVRTDGLVIGLLSWALVLSAGSTRLTAIAGGLCLAVAFMAKHNAAIFGLPIALVMWRQHGWRHALTFGLSAAVPAALFTIGMQVATGGLFLMWLLEVPASHGMVAARILPAAEVLSWWPFKVKTGGAVMEVIRAMPFVWLFGLVAVVAWVRTPKGVYWLAISATALVTVSLMRGHTGGFINVLIPMFWVQAIWPAVIGAGLAQRRAWGWHLACVAVGVSLWFGRDDLTKFIPTEKDRATAAKLIEEIRTLPEPLAIPHAPYYAVLAGKEPSFSLICLWDIDHRGGPFRGGVRRMDKAIADHHWAAIVLPDDTLGHGLKDHYRQQRRLRAGIVGTRTGWGVRLKQIWVPKEEPAAPGADAGAPPPVPPAAP